MYIFFFFKHTVSHCWYDLPSLLKCSILHCITEWTVMHVFSDPCFTLQRKRSAFECIHGVHIDFPRRQIHFTLDVVNLCSLLKIFPFTIHSIMKQGVKSSVAYISLVYPQTYCVKKPPTSTCFRLIKYVLYILIPWIDMKDLYFLYICVNRWTINGT